MFFQDFYTKKGKNFLQPLLYLLVTKKTTNFRKIESWLHTGEVVSLRKRKRFLWNWIEMEKMNKFQRGAGPMKWLTGGNISELLVRWQNKGDGSLVMGFPMLPESSMPHYGIEEAEPTIDPRRSTQVKTKGILGEIKCDMRWVRWCRALAQLWMVCGVWRINEIDSFIE